MRYALALAGAVVVSASLPVRSGQDVATAPLTPDIPADPGRNGHDHSLAALQLSMQPQAFSLARRKARPGQPGQHTAAEPKQPSGQDGQLSPVRFWGLKRADPADAGVGPAKLWGVKKAKATGGSLARPFWGDKAREAAPTKERREQKAEAQGAPGRGEHRALEPEKPGRGEHRQQNMQELEKQGRGEHWALARDQPSQQRQERAAEGAGSRAGPQQDAVPGTYQDRVRAKEPSASGRSHKQLVIIIVIIAVVMGMISCAVGLQMRTRPRGQVAGDARIQKEFNENQGPPPHLRVRHWLTGSATK